MLFKKLPISRTLKPGILYLIKILRLIEMVSVKESIKVLNVHKPNEQHYKYKYKNIFSTYLFV